MHSVTPSLAVAAEQYACQASATGGWACDSQVASDKLPARPIRAPSVSTVASETATADAGTAPVGILPISKNAPGGRAAADFSRIDWVPRDQLSAAQLAEAGPYCSGAYIEPKRPGMNDDTPLNESPMYVSAKASRYAQQEQVATLAGDVVLRQAGMQVEADEANLYQAENRAELVGDVRIRDKGMLVTGDRAELQLDNGEVKVEDAEYVVHAAHARGDAQYIKREESAIIRLKDGTYTRCEPGDNAWQMSGNNIKLDPNTGFGTANNVVLRVKDIPVFYTPYIHFPIDDRRQSGFLAPSMSSSSGDGFTLSTPYYFNLAPNYDATLTPTYMADRGLLMEGEGRYMTKSSQGQFGAAYLNDENNDRKLQSDYEETRWLYSWQHVDGLDSRLLAEVDYTDISDPYYFQDLDTNLGIDTPSFVNQQGALTWRGDSYTARLNAQAYELATVTDITPYNRLPQITLNGMVPVEAGGLQMTYASELVRFDRDLRDGYYTDENGNSNELWLDENIYGLARANGDRTYLQPGVSLPFNWASGFITPSIKYSYTDYQLDLDSTGKSDLVASGENYNDAPNRSVPIYNVDSGLYFDRNTQLFGKGYRQTLEPRLYYLYVPEEDQDDIPVFDSGEPNFSYASLFRDNRFTGRDRIGDENKLSLGVTTRWIAPNGFEQQTFSIGQAAYFSDRKVQMPGIEYEDRDDAKTSTSPYALQHVYRFNRDWRLASDFNWDKNTHSTRSGSTMFHYQPEDDLNKMVNLGYRYSNDTIVYDPDTGKWQQGGDYGTPGSSNYVEDYYKISQHDFSTIWPLVPQWSAIARWQYDYNQARTLEAFGGFEYDSCCWKLRLVNRYWIATDEVSLNPNQNEQGDRGIFLQIVLKGLGGVVGNQVDGFLDQGIQGYREREDQAY